LTQLKNFGEGQVLVEKRLIEPLQRENNIDIGSDRPRRRLEDKVLKTYFLFFDSIEVASETHNFYSFADNGANLTVVMMFPISRGSSAVMLAFRRQHGKQATASKKSKRRRTISQRQTGTIYSGTIHHVTSEHGVRFHSQETLEVSRVSTRDEGLVGIHWKRKPSNHFLTSKLRWKEDLITPEILDEFSEVEDE
jgi:hypothetical protein